ncbi:pyruvate dehydrogenase complex, E2 component, dihydrolipoamide acetyltransferase (plasmid) [Phenylobacterium zucineum HLK1]|uniref:Pyruvate dehydrogenase complex, E2 component, dihydrolipoamide acetyltransferase n=2 Tax=Caulobacteraceae TaxID=76892 RepID=B4RIF0_PHEZH|nr:pyruvate dehydrogenase complex, E2 component, dihydrolipoamide acetyltransferase [Phenylobacterium zucineum HLK1]
MRRIAEIRASQDLWATSMLPEGTVERWMVETGATVARGDAVMEVRIEDALHEIVAPVSGRVVALAVVDAVIEPGSVLGEIAAPV